MEVFVITDGGCEMKKFILSITIIGTTLIIIGLIISFAFDSPSEEPQQLSDQYFEYTSMKFNYNEGKNYWVQTIKNVSNKDIYIDYAVVNIKSNTVKDKDIYLDNVSIKRKIKRNESFDVKVPITLEENETFYTTYVFFGTNNGK